MELIWLAPDIQREILEFPSTANLEVSRERGSCAANCREAVLGRTEGTLGKPQETQPLRATQFSTVIHSHFPSRKNIQSGINRLRCEFLFALCSP
jgi:hypothetical protein